MSRAFLGIVAAVACLVAAHSLIISVDVGSDSMKIALVKPGLPFHIVNNPQSKRKVWSSSRFSISNAVLSCHVAAVRACLPHASACACRADARSRHIP